MPEAQLRCYSQRTKLKTVQRQLDPDQRLYVTVVIQSTIFCLTISRAGMFLKSTCYQKPLTLDSILFQTQPRTSNR